MRRIDKALEVIEDVTLLEIVEQYCPSEAGVAKWFMDLKTYKDPVDSLGNPTIQGCRGITCQECWETEIEEAEEHESTLII